jgi:cysteine desulfurase
MPEQVPIYLDNAATTQPLPEVVEAMARVQRDEFGNPSSPHAFGGTPRKLLDDAREFLRGTVGAAQVVLTSGGSEADFLGLVGAAAARPPGRVLVAATDHPALLRCAGILGRLRHHVTTLPVTHYGDVHPEALFEHLGPDVRVLSILHGHNELGTLAEVEEMVSLVRRVAPDAHVHVDLVQSYGKIPFDLDDSGVDSVAVSAHKLHGPRGVGFLALSSVAKVEPLMVAGGQEHGMRGGTENVAGAVGLMLAAEAAFSHQHRVAEQTSAMAGRIERAVLAAIPDAERLGHPQRRLPHILSLRIRGLVASTLLERCDARGLAFSTGAACHGQGPPGDNHVLSAIGLDRGAQREVLRLSFSRFTTDEEVERAIAILVEEAQLLLRASPRRARSERAQGGSA